MTGVHRRFDEGDDGMDVDLRREWMAAAADAASLLRRRAELLDPRDRALIHMYLAGELKTCRVAELMGVSPSTLTRRIKGLIRRMTDPVVAALAEADGDVSPVQRRVALEILLHRKPKADVARAMGMTRGEINDVLGFVRGWARTRRGRVPGH